MTEFKTWMEWGLPALKAAGIVLGTLLVSRLATKAFERYSHKKGLQISDLSLPRILIQGLMLVLGLLMVLDNLGISIAPLLTALGVGSLAVALALQDTLGNFFAGLNIILAGNIKAGDYLKFQSGPEGTVLDIGWRSSRLRELAGNLILMPNTHLAQAVITNYDRPLADSAVLVEAGVDYASDLSQVEKVSCEVAAQVMQEVAGGVPDFQPFIRFHDLGDSAIQFTVILRGQTFVDRYLVKHEFIKRLHARFKKEGIEIPFPQRVLSYRDGGKEDS